MGKKLNIPAPSKCITPEVCGCCGGKVHGRHRKPTDPEWWGDSHWPTPLPHESASWNSTKANIPLEVSEAKESTSEVPRPASSSTGLITKNDFIQELKTLGLFEPILVNKIAAWFAKADRGECGAGMCRMQCNNLIKSALKRKSK